MQDSFKMSNMKEGGILKQKQENEYIHNTLHLFSEKER